MATEAFVEPEIASLMGLIDTHLRWKQVQTQYDRSYARYHPSELGKAQPLDAVLQTPSGPILMGQVQIGQELLDPFGGTTRVEEIIPQGERDVYEIEFDNGDVVKASDEHLWLVDSKYLEFKNPKLLTTKQIKERFLCGVENRKIYEIQMPQSVRFDTQEKLLIDPYIMGLLLGDGCLRCHSLDFTSIDKELVNSLALFIDKENYEVRSRSLAQHRIAKVSSSSHKENIYRQELRRLKLEGLYSHEKFIPDCYKFSSVEDRLSLIQGLMDTDGTVDKKGQVAEFNTSSKKLSDDFNFIIESLGGFVRFSVKKTTHRDCYRSRVVYEDRSSLFRLSRKKNRCVPKINKVKRLIADVRYVGKENVQCIRVSAENGLYLTDHFIVTHNCLRRQQYKHLAHEGFMKVEPVIHSSKMQRLFDKGHNMHHRWQQFYFADMGILKGYWKCPSCGKVYGKEETLGVFSPEKCEKCGFKGKFNYLEIDVLDDEMNIAGHADIILDFSRFDPDRYKGVRSAFNPEHLPKKPIVVDMKTIGSMQWNKKLKQYGLHKEYLIQITIYCHILDCEYGVVIYENKDNSDACAYKVPRNDELFKKIKEQTVIMKKLADRTVDGKRLPLLPPPKPLEKSDYECSNCEFASLCHKSKIWDDPELVEKRKSFYGITL